MIDHQNAKADPVPLYKFAKGDLVLHPPNDRIGMVVAMSVTGRAMVQWGTHKERIPERDLISASFFPGGTQSFIRGNLFNAVGMRLGRNRTLSKVVQGSG